MWRGMIYIYIYIYEIWGSHDGQNVDVGLPGCKVLWKCSQITNVSEEHTAFIFACNIYLKIHTALQPSLKNFMLE
jgi:hypothetical protein